MKRNPTIPVFILILLYIMAPPTLNTQPRLSVDNLTITVEYDGREIGYTNKQAGHYYTLTGSHHTSGWQGWTVMDVRLLDDYQIIAGEDDLLRTRTNAVVQVMPHQLRRTYASGFEETFTFIDSLDAFVVDVLPGKEAKYISFYPRFTQSHNPDDYIVKQREGMLLICLQSYDERTADHPGWIAIAADGHEPVVEQFLPRKEEADIVDGRSFAPAGMTVNNVTSDRSVRWIVVAGKTEDHALTLARYVLDNGDSLIDRRKLRMQHLLDDSYVLTSHERFTKALAWARISMDALIMNQTGMGIYAGLPWFNNYWGRDTFISFSGAVLATGQFGTAREILRSFAEFQDTDAESPTYGRIPNRVTTREIIYNTTDGTPRFVRELYQYYRYSGDDALIQELYPVVRRSVDGALKNYADEYYFLTHADADTWMDAVGPDGPWSPRGNRAVDIQFLWYRHLTDGASMAEIAGDRENAEHWREIARTLRANFNKHFINKDNLVVYDRLKKDGTPDACVRPNQIFAFDMIDDDDVKKAMLRSVVGELTYSWGVASLSQYDSGFHPFHHYPPYYVPDAAYHNGIVWTWLIGSVIDAAVQYDMQDIIFEVTENIVRQILDRGGVGTFSELLDAFPREQEGESELSGTFTQAWNLAEFIRTAYQAYIGVRIDVPAAGITLNPKLPKALGNVASKIRFGETQIAVTCTRDGDNVYITLAPDGLDQPVTVQLKWVLNSGDAWYATGMLEPGDSLLFELTDEQITISPGTNADFRRIEGSSRLAELAGIKLAEPEWQEYWTSLRGPDHPLLTHDTVKKDRGDAQLLIDIEDAAFDDTGPYGTYQYPTNPNFKDGILDLLRFTVWTDNDYSYFRLRFRNLHDPGYHPHYGFQLTYTAILVDRGEAGPGMQDAGANSLFVLDTALGNFDRAIYVGGGIRIVDAKHNILSEYIPAPHDIVNPLGNVRMNEVAFAVPNTYLGKPDETWRYLVLVGAQDDHGGAGLGVFRSVQRTAGEWHGGGKQSPDDPNVYDILQPVDPGENIPRDP
jgi:glycogen debranching enzyme